MAFTFNSTASSASANSYASVTEFDDYVASHVFLDLNLSTEQKQKLLAMATRLLESLTFGGYKPTTTQALQFPRVGLVDKHGISIDQTVIPTPLKDAQIELALWLLDNEVRSFNEGEDKRVAGSYTAGSLTFNYRELANPDELPLRVQQLLKDIGPKAWIHRRSSLQFRM